jgi:LruC domain-containing protein/uncharacterized repeat protein (TIGR01451 family)
MSGNVATQRKYTWWMMAAIVVMLIAAGFAPAVTSAQAGGNPVLAITQTVSQEPLLAGQAVFRLTVGNNGITPVTDRGYNLTITDTLPVGFTYVSANPTPTNVSAQADGATLLTWDNIADLEAGERLTVDIVAALAPTVKVVDELVNRAGAKINRMPDNSGAWIEQTAQLAVRPQAIDIETTIQQSTADEQATGAGEYAASPGGKPGADWPFQVKVVVRNNNVGPTNNVAARITLPAGIAYLGNVVFSTNPNGVATNPLLALKQDGSLDLTWVLGNVTTAQFATPIEITFQAAIPYRYRAVTDSAARNGPFAGPMNGEIIAEDAVMSVRYEATGLYDNAPTADGSEATPADDLPAQTTAELLTISKGVTPTTVGIGTEVTYSLTYYVSEYYTATSVTLVDVLPDGMIYIEESANLAPISVTPDTPNTGQTTIVWALPASATTPGASAAITFRAFVDTTYKAAPLTGQPVVSGDRLTNRVTSSGDWQDAISLQRVGTLTPDTSSATVSTRMPTFNKVALDPNTQQWVSSINAFVGDTVTFRLTYAAAPDIDAKGIVIRDFLPRGMTYVAGSAVHTVNGVFTDGTGCTAAPQTPVVGVLGGLQYVEWRLCNAVRGGDWEARIQAVVGPTPNVQPGWIVANLGKLSGANSYGLNYSLRAMASTNYRAPRLVLTKSATPGSNLQADSVVNYTIRVTNAGDATAYNLSLLDTVPASLIMPNSGGSASPNAATYTATSGDPASGAGGVLTWSMIGALAPGETQSFTYRATVATGLAAGAALNNVASVAYNSRSDNRGHAVAHSANSEDDQTDDVTVYIKNLTIAKSGARIGGIGASDQLSIGDQMRWTLTVTVPAGVVAYWPVVEENDLPLGFNYITGSRTVQGVGVTFDDEPSHHSKNPKISTNPTDLRFYLNTVDNTASLTPFVFTLGFDTVVTGVRQDQPNTVYYTNNTLLSDAINTTYVGWYDSAAGYNNSGYAYDAGFETNRIDRRSPRGRFTAKVRQPYLTLQKVASSNRVGAGDEIVYTVLLRNQGFSTAYDMKLRDVLPADLFLLAIDSIEKPENTTVSPTSASGATYAYWVDRLDAGATVKIVYRVQVNPAVPADSSLTNTVSVEEYSTQPGNAAIERTYTGPRTTASVHTPQGSILKSVTANELTYGSTLVYSLLAPGEPINATMTNVVVSDTIDSRFVIEGVVNGSFDAETNVVTALFATIPPNTQQVVEITVRLPEESAAGARIGAPTPEQFRDLELLQPAVNAAVVGNPVMPGTMLYNRGWVHYDKGGLKGSNYVSSRVVAPALVVDHQVAQLEARPGEQVDYTVTVSNVGNGRAENLVLNVALPANILFVPGSALLNGAPFEISALNGVVLPVLLGESEHLLTFKASVVSAEAGVAYGSVVQATASDSRGAPIRADNSVRVPADTDPDDRASALIYGPLVWSYESVFVAYEDLKNVGWSDWDYNDFIVKIDFAKGATANGDLAALLLDYEAMARGASYDHRFLHGLPIYGGGNYLLSVRNAEEQIIATRSGLFTEDEPALAIFERTRQTLPLQTEITDPRYRLFTNTAPVQTWVQKGWTAHLQVVLADPSLNLADALPPAPWDPYLHVLSTNQTIHLVQPGRTGNTQVVNQAWDPNSPLAGYDLPLAHVFDARWKWPQEFLGLWRVYPDYTLFQLSDGFNNGQWWDPSLATTYMEYAWQGGGMVAAAEVDQALVNVSRYYAAPVVADLDSDGEPEIIVGNLTRWQVEVYDSSGQLRADWPQLLRSGVKSAAAIGDLNGDGAADVLVGDLRGYLHAFDADGNALAGWPIKTGINAEADYRILAQPQIVDLDGDGQPEIVLALSDSRLYVYAANGALRSGWPVSLGDAPDIYGSHVIDSAPVVADINGDGQQEIVVGSYDHNLYVYRADGQLLWAYPTRDVIMSTPSVGDVAPGSPGMEIVVGSGDRFVYLLSSDGQLLWKRATGWIVRSSPLLVDLERDGALEIVIGSDDNKVWAWRNNGERVEGWPLETGAAVVSSPIAADLDGDGQPEVIVGSDDGYVYAWRSDGAAFEGWPKNAGYPVKSAPALLRISGVFEPEIVVANYDGAIKVLGGPLPLYLPLIGR